MTGPLTPVSPNAPADPPQGRALEAQVGELLRVRRLMLATAESSTGGLISSRLTDVPGSSDYMLGGVVAYADEAKLQMLGVRPRTVAQHGAVSDPVTRQMATGARIMFGADVAVSVTGIAGPGGATETKPLGLTFVGLSAPDGVWVRRFVFEGDRAANKRASAEAALRLLLDYLNGELAP
jgi:PncC family amidohydrolase